MTEELEQYDARSSALLEADEHVQFDASFFDRPLSNRSMELDELVVKKGSTNYNSYHRVDRMELVIDRNLCRYLGLLILWAAFDGRDDDIVIRLCSEHSDVKLLKIRPSWNMDSYSQLTVKPKNYAYDFNEVHKHPWYLEKLPPESLPQFFLTNEDECVVNEWESRDTVIITGNLDAQFNLADLLMTIGLDRTKRSEFVLESEIGFRGVGPGSVEVVFWLPGSLGWIYRS